MDKTDTDVSTSLPQPAFANSNSIVDYPTFVSRQNLFTGEQTYSGDYSETNIFECVKPLFINTAPLGTSAILRYMRPFLMVKDNHNIPKHSAVGIGTVATNFNDNQFVSVYYDNHMEKTPYEIVEVQSTTQFTILVRNLQGSAVRIEYPASDQSAFVSSTNLSNEANGAQTNLAATFINNADDSTTVGSRSGQTIDVTVVDGTVTALTINTLGSNYVTGDLLSITLAGGATVTYRYVNGQTVFSNFNAVFPLTINTHAAHNFSVGDYFTVEHDNPSNTLLGGGSPTHARGSVFVVDNDAIFFFYRGITQANWNDMTYTQASSSVNLIASGATIPTNVDKINPTQMTLAGSANAVVQMLNPQFKAVKMTCSAAWEVKKLGDSSFTSVAANQEYILRYNGLEDGGFFAKDPASGTPTLNWQYFVG